MNLLKNVVLGILSGAAVAALSAALYYQGYADGVASVPPEDCAAEVQVAEQGAYGAGVKEAVSAAQAYILESCTRQKEITVAGETFICLKKQEM